MAQSIAQTIRTLNVRVTFNSPSCCGAAKPELKAAADRVIGRNTDDGLARFLEELTKVPA
jgi:hydroxymethylpyrimidine pyrophosphatase-like HAD family hydrolase